MTKLFAASLAQKMSLEFLPGEYDPEQELWVSDNQLQGYFPTPTGTKTTHKRGTTYQTLKWTGMILDDDIGLDTETVSDSDSDSDM